MSFEPGLAVYPILLICVGALYFHQFKKIARSDSCAAPQVWTWTPWLGGAFGLFWNSPKYLIQYWNTYGPNFQIVIAGQPFTFIADPAALDAFFRDRSGCLSFDELQDLAPYVIGGLEPSSTTRNLISTVLLPIIINGNTHPSLCEIVPRFNAELHGYIMQAHDTATTPISLQRLTSHALFHCTHIAVFGSSFPVNIFDDFTAIDEASYNLLMHAPVVSWAASSARTRARGALKAFMKPWSDPHVALNVDDVTPYGDNVLYALAQSDLSLDEQASLFLSYIWGSSTNVGRVVFWLFAHLLEDREAYRRLQAEIDSAIQQEFDDALSGLLSAHPSVINGPSFALLDCAIKECFRLHLLPMSHRVATAPMTMSSGQGAINVSAGDHIMANTTAVHWDGSKFAEPHVFNIDRFAKGDKASSLYAWGKGAHVCPGRHMATYYMKMLVIMILHHFDISPTQDHSMCPADYPRSTGVMTPRSDIHVKLTLRSEPGNDKVDC